MKRLICVWVLIYILFKLGILLEPFSTGKASIRQAFREENDIYFVGSSHVFCSYNPIHIQNRTRFNVGMASSNGQPPIGSYYIIKKLLKKKSTEIIYLDIYMFTRNSSKLGPHNEVLDTLSIFERYNYLKMLNKQRKEKLGFDYLFNLTKYHSNWKRSGLIKANWNNIASYIGLKYSRESHPYKGYYPFTKAQGNKKLLKQIPDDWFVKNLKSNMIFPIEYYKEEILVKLFIQSKALKKKLILIDAPYYSAKDNRGEVNYIKMLANKHSIDFIDFNEKYEELGLSKSDFKDTDHTNKYGALKLSNYFTRLLNKKL